MVRTRWRYKIMPYINGFTRFSTTKWQRKSWRYIQQANTRGFLGKALLAYLSSSTQKKPLWLLLVMKSRKELVILVPSVEKQNGYWIAPSIQRMSRYSCNTYHWRAEEAINTVVPCVPFFSLLYRTNPGFQITEAGIISGLHTRPVPGPTCSSCPASKVWTPALVPLHRSEFHPTETIYPKQEQSTSF